MIHSATRSTSSRSILERLWQTLPDERENLRPYVEKAKSYRNECGCELGGVFLVGALAFLLFDIIFIHRISGGGWLAGTLHGSAFVLGTSILGKAIGIGVARMRLAMVYRGLRNRYRIVGE